MTKAAARRSTKLRKPCLRDGLLGLVAAALFLAVPVTTVHALRTLEVSSESSALQPDNHSIYELVLGKSIERELLGATSHSYRVRVASGEYIRLIVDKRDLDILVKVFAQDSQKIHEFTSRRYGPTEVSWVAKSSGICRLDLGQLEASARAGRYELRIETIRAATPQDAISVTASVSNGISIISSAAL